MTAVDGDFPLSAETTEMLVHIVAALPAPFHQLGVHGSRLAMRSLTTEPAQDERAGTAIVVPGRDGPITVRVYRPASDANVVPVIVYLHGGGWTLGSLDGVDPFCRGLASSTAAAVISVEYRLAPEHPYPAALNDCADVLAWLRLAPDGLAFEPGPVALAGDSAGGNLAIALCLQLRDQNETLPVAQAVAYPGFDHVDTTAYPSCHDYAHAPILTSADIDWFFTNYLGDRDRNPLLWADPYAVPARAKHLRGLPPTMVIAAECDPLRDCGITFAQRLAHDGGTVRHRTIAGTVHGFATEVGQLAAADLALAEISAFLRAAFSSLEADVTPNLVHR